MDALSTHILGIETSCDETAAAVVRRDADGTGHILSNIVLSQIKDHAPYGGVVPEIAARAHIEHLDRLVGQAMSEAGKSFTDLDGVAATAGPGLLGGVIVGLTMAKAIALANGKPLIAVNHLEGHALTARLLGPCAFPYLLLLISGGHTQFQIVEAFASWGLAPSPERARFAAGGFRESQGSPEARSRTSRANGRGRLFPETGRAGPPRA